MFRNVVLDAEMPKNFQEMQEKGINDMQWERPWNWRVEEGIEPADASLITPGCQAREHVSHLLRGPPRERPCWPHRPVPRTRPIA